MTYLRRILRKPASRLPSVRFKTGDSVISFSRYAPKLP